MASEKIGGLPKNELGEPKKAFSETFSAVTALTTEFPPSRIPVSNMSEISELLERDVGAARRALMVECGLDAFYQAPEVWLSLAVAAEARGHGTLQRDYERAMEIANKRYSSTPLQALQEQVK